ncbi:MAG: ATP synthase F0 subunit C [Deltaproteobacteria bacterium]|nr:ATP synthase F0 subunit C [Deltaproteobacteria bacterium]
MKTLTFLFTVVLSVIVSGLVYAETGEVAAAAGLGAFGPFFMMGLASGLGTLAQSRAAAAALEGIARNPQSVAQVQTPLILSLAFMESLVLFSLLVVFVK